MATFSLVVMIVVVIGVVVLILLFERRRAREIQRDLRAPERPSAPFHRWERERKE
jgi:Na+/H+ antiporter NhaD/arsenite permease-like protein